MRDDIIRRAVQEGEALHARNEALARQIRAEAEDPTWIQVNYHIDQLEANIRSAAAGGRKFVRIVIPRPGDLVYEIDKDRFKAGIRAAANSLGLRVQDARGRYSDSKVTGFGGGGPTGDFEALDLYW